MKRALSGFILLVLSAGGCGDRALWDRWQAESSLYHARVAEHRVLESDRPSAPGSARVELRLQGIVDRFPAAAWVPRAGAPGPARDVAIAGGNAAVDLGLLLVHRGLDARASEQFARVEREYAPLPGVVLPARVARIAALERLNRFEEAMAERHALAAMDPMGDPGNHGVLQAVLLAPLDLAVRLRDGGREREADAELASAESAFAGALARVHGEDLALLAEALSRVRSARHEAGGALAALRVAMHAAPAWQVPYYARAMAARALDAGAPESVFAYARWAASLRGSRDVAGPAWFAAGKAWEALGRPDSALAEYDAALRQWSDPGYLGPLVRYQRAHLLEGLGQWERAQAGYLALQARYPTDPLSFEAALRVVRYHMQHGEPELARATGGQAIHNLDHMLATNRDSTFQRDALAARADLLLSLGELAQAQAGLLDLWRRFPEDSLAEDAGLRAARLAEHQPGGAARSDSILRELRRGAASPAVRRAAGQQAALPPEPREGRR